MNISKYAFNLLAISSLFSLEASPAAQIFSSSRETTSPIINPQGAALFTYVNESTIEDENVFLQVVGINPKTGIQCFVIYDTQANPSYYDVVEEVDSRNYAFPLAYFPLSTQETGRMIYLPQLDGGRIYTSIDEKIIFLVVENDKEEWTICAPNPLNPSDPNKNIVWDKTEYTVDATTVFINPTAVDNFSLPLFCKEIGNDGTSQSGGLMVSRQTVFTNAENIFLQAGAPWDQLLPKIPSLIYSPMYGSATGIFPQDLFITSGWIDAFIKIFSTSALQIDAEESLPINLGGGIWQGIIEAATNKITFVRNVDETHPPIPPVTLTLPTNTSELIGGAGPSWDIEDGNALQAVFARNLSCAIDTNTLTTITPLSQKYFKENSNLFYQKNDQMPEDLQFIDYYSKTLHSFGNHQIYTIPYDDELGQSGSASYTLQNFAGGTIKLGPLN